MKPRNMIPMNQVVPKSVVLINQPRLLRDMLRVVLERTAGLLVIAHGSTLAEVDSAIAEAQVAWLVVTLDEDGEMPEDACALLSAQRVGSLLGISMDGSNLVVFSYQEPGQIERRSLHNISLHQLLSLLNPARSFLFVA